jgi:hypothetical protein
VDRNEASLLHVFDVNRARIQESASVAYSRRQQNYYRLSALDILDPVHRGVKRGGIMGRGDRRDNREGKKPKKPKPKEIAPVSTLASIQKKALEAGTPKKKLEKTATMTRILGRRS